MALLRLSAPWQIFYKELNELFKKDPEIHIVYDTDEQEINLYIENQVKADALAEILPEELSFGSVKVQINVIPANKCNNRRSTGSLYKDAFYGNPIVNEIVTLEGIMTNPITYVIFKKEVVQYYNDDLGDAHGMCSTLYQDMAYRVFEEKEGIFFCTDIKNGTIVYTTTSGYITGNTATPTI